MLEHAIGVAQTDTDCAGVWDVLEEPLDAREAAFDGDDIRVGEEHDLGSALPEPVVNSCGETDVSLLGEKFGGGDPPNGARRRRIFGRVIDDNDAASGRNEPREHREARVEKRPTVKRDDQHVE